MLNERAAAELERFHEWANKHGFLIGAAWRSMAVPGGDWPNAESLTRKLFNSHRRLDVATVASNMPPPMGRLADGRLVLTVRGASYYGGAKKYLRSYVGVVRLALARYGDPSAEPVVSTSDLIDLGLTPKWGVPIMERILEGEPWALSPAGGEAGDKRYRLSPNAAFPLATVHTLPKYLEAQANAWWPADSPTVAGLPIEQSAPAQVPTATTPVAGHGAMDIGWMHPAIRDACERLLRDGHLREAVQRAATVLQAEIRRLARTDLDGDALMNMAFARQKPRIVVANRRTQSGQSIQRGTHLLAQGIVAAIRNPTSHDLVEFSDAEAVECLAVMSLIHRRLDDAESRRARSRARKSSTSRRS